MRHPRGFALLAVLWVVVALSALTAGALARVRADLSGTEDRILIVRARWAAEGCLADALAELDAALGQSGAFAPAGFDTLHYANGAQCASEMLDPGSRLNLDSLGPAIRARFDSLLADAGDTSASARSAFVTTYGDGRVNLNTARDIVIAALPGVGGEARRVIAEARAWHRPIADLNDLAGRLSPPGRDLLLAHYAELLRLVAFRTTALVVTSRGWTASPAPAATIEVLVVNAGRRAAVVRRRMW